MKKNTIIEIISLLFVILFMYTAISKFMDFTLFRGQIEITPVIGPFAKWIAWIVPLAEIIDSILLMVPAWRQKGLYLALGLMVAFTIYISLLLKFSPHLPCSCGGVIELLSWRDHLIFNCVFILLGATGIWLSRHREARFSSTHSHL
jgi:uncharacterized membrane protein YphA (DoxX/SURF4 family)